MNIPICVVLNPYFYIPFWSMGVGFEARIGSGLTVRVTVTVENELTIYLTE